MVRGLEPSPTCPARQAQQVAAEPRTAGQPGRPTVSPPPVSPAKASPIQRPTARLPQPGRPPAPEPPGASLRSPTAAASVRGTASAPQRQLPALSLSPGVGRGASQHPAPWALGPAATVQSVVPRDTAQPKGPGAWPHSLTVPPERDLPPERDRAPEERPAPQEGPGPPRGAHQAHPVGQAPRAFTQAGAARRVPGCELQQGARWQGSGPELCYGGAGLCPHFVHRESRARRYCLTQSSQQGIGDHPAPWGGRRLMGRLGLARGLPGVTLTP